MFTPEQKTKFASGQPVYMTSAEGEVLATNGLIEANPAQKDPNNQNAFLVTLTPAGQQALNAPVAPPTAPGTPATPPAVPAAPQAAPAVPTAPASSEAAPTTPPVTTGVGFDASQTDNIGAIRNDVGLPAPKPRGGGSRNVGSRYPYEQLPEPVVGQQPPSFHVKIEEGKTIEDLIKKMSSNTSAANKRYEEPDLDASGQTQQEAWEKRTYNRDENGDYVIGENGKRTSTLTPATRIKMKRTRKFVSHQVGSADPEGEGVRVYRVVLS